ncbi:hypothetical protein ACQJBY_001836 [Aegilops geniculata]
MYQPPSLMEMWLHTVPASSPSMMRSVSAQKSCLLLASCAARRASCVTQIKRYQFTCQMTLLWRHVCCFSMTTKPYYGQNVFVLDRDDEYALVVSHGSILYLEKPLFERNHYMFASYNSSLTCICGPVIDNNGEVIGLTTSHLPQSAILSISIVKKCIQMWNKFGYVPKFYRL